MCFQLMSFFLFLLQSGFTPLHIAAHYGNENIAKLLLDKNADVNYSAKVNFRVLNFQV